MSMQAVPQRQKIRLAPFEVRLVLLVAGAAARFEV